MKSKAATPDEYLKQLPEDRRTAIQAVRKVILKNLPKGYEEVLQYGMLGYVVPLKVFPAGYLNRKTEPLPYVCLASQKNYMSIYMMSVYGDAEAGFERNTWGPASGSTWESAAFDSGSSKIFRST